MEQKKNNSEEAKKEEFDVVKGDGKDLNISPVYDHIKFDKKKDEPNIEKKEVIVPKKKKFEK